MVPFLYLVDHFSVRALDSDVDVEESALGDLEHEAHLGAHLDLVEKTFFRVSVNLEKLNLRKIVSTLSLDLVFPWFVGRLTVMKYAVDL